MSINSPFSLFFNTLSDRLVSADPAFNKKMVFDDSIKVMTIRPYKVRGKISIPG